MYGERRLHKDQKWDSVKDTETEPIAFFIWENIVYLSHLSLG